jgi:hypothetical protein
VSRPANVSTPRRRRARATSLVCALGLGVISLAGCSQIDSLQQVSGVPENTLQIAIGYELIDNKVPILVAPVCTQNPDEAGAFTCIGKTTEGEEISVTTTKATAETFTLAPGGNPTELPSGTLDYAMTIKVGDKQIYDGGVQAAISANQDGAQ